MSYTPPASAKPFRLNVSDQDLSEWRQLLQLSKLGPVTYENQQTENNFGITYKWLSDAKDYWLNTYDWRKHEAHINSFDNFKMQIDDIDLHFVGQFSDKKDAVPIVFMHGWPGSHIEFLPMLELLKNKYSKKDAPYHVIVPSLPGYTLSSSGPLDKNWTLQDTGEIIHKLMLNLGFERYLAQGGDVGSFVAKLLSAKYDECVGIHLNMFSHEENLDKENRSALQKKAIERVEAFRASGFAYAQEHATRPSTIGHVISSNPLAPLAWIGEKFIEWSDTTPPLDEILTNVSLYWFTGGYPRSIYPYRQLFGPTRPQNVYLDKPTGYSLFSKEIVPVFEDILPKLCNLVQYKEHEKGGHFAALEQPAVFLADVEEYVGKAWKASGEAKL